MGLVLGVADHFRAELAETLKRRSSRHRPGNVADEPGVAHSSAIVTTNLEPGSHIYSYRRWGFYSHHGIYEGNGYVIHFTRTEEPEGIEAIAHSSSSRAQDDSTNRSSCPKCCDMSSVNQGVAAVLFPRGVIKTCLECFLRDGSRLRQPCLYSYRVPWWQRWLSVPGSCTGTEATTSQSQVIETAQKLQSAKSFDKYHLLHNNCEHFATFCCTGMRISEQTAAWAWLVLKLNPIKPAWAWFVLKLCTLKVVFLRRVMPSAPDVACKKID